MFAIPHYISAIERDLTTMATDAIDTRSQGATHSSDPRTRAFLPSKLFSLLSSPTPTVTSTLASTPTKSVESAAEQLYGKHHGYAHHSLHADEEKEHESPQEAGTMDKIMGKLHLSKSHSHHDGEGKDKDEQNPAADQWAAMRLLHPAELEEIRKCGRWGSSQPSELFLNVRHHPLYDGLA